MKTPIRKLNSSKLFYNKWPYKVECRQVGANRIVHNGAALCKEWCLTGKGLRFPPYDTKSIDKVQFSAFIHAAEKFLDMTEDIRIRVEGSHFNLFCKDLTILEEIDNVLFPWVQKIVGPTTPEELKFLLSNGHKKILRDSFPKEKYRYRIFFKTKFPADKRFLFVDWADKYGDKIDISGTSRLWLTGKRHYSQDPFMYVEDDKMLSMVGMYLSGYVKKVEEFILRENALVT